MSAYFKRIAEGARNAYNAIPRTENCAMGLGAIALASAVTALVIGLIVSGQVPTDSPAKATIGDVVNYGIGGTAGGAVVFGFGKCIRNYRMKAEEKANKKNDDAAQSSEETARLTEESSEADNDTSSEQGEQ